MDMLWQLREQQRSQLVDMVVHIIEELLQCYMKNMTQQLKDHMEQVQHQLDGMQELMARHFRSMTTCETEESVVDELWKPQIADLSSKVQSFENLTTLIMDNQMANRTQIKELTKKQEQLQLDLVSTNQQIREDLRSYLMESIKDKIKHQWKVIEDLANRIDEMQTKNRKPVKI